MPLMRRRPLLRAAAVGGGAYMAGKRRARNQDYAAEQETQQDERLSALENQPAAPAAAAPGPAGPSSDAISQLKELGQLHEQGILTDEEFAAQKAKVLG
jgi:putative oligomerization/nucleic acid binding protein